MRPSLSPTPAASPVAAPAAADPGRLMSLDALRGFDMFWILGGDALVRALGAMSESRAGRALAEQFEHVQWEGLHAYDVIYPLFLFLIGVSIVLSLDKALERDSRAVVLRRVVRRAVILFALNFVYNGGFTTRWPDIRVASGVLAMIAASYALAAPLYCFFHQRLKTLAAITGGLLVLNWALLTFVPFPDFRLDEPTIEALAAKAGSHDPAAVAAQVPQRTRGSYEERHNLSNYLDYRFLPGKLLNRYYENQGLLSPLSSVTLCLAGIFAARLLKRTETAPRRKVILLAAAGAGALAAGWPLSLELPVIKKLWTSSYCLVTAGWSALLLAAFFLVVDVWQRRAWCQPFVWIGVNPITLYLLYGLVEFRRIAERLGGGDVKAWFNGVAAGLGDVFVAGIVIALVLALARFLHHRRIYLRV